MGNRTEGLLSRNSPLSCLRCVSRNRAPILNSQTDVRRSADRIPPGPDHYPLSNLRRPARLLPPFRQSSRTSRALSLRVPRPRTPATLRLHLHRLAAGEFLAGCQRRLPEGKNLPSTRRPDPLSSLGE